MIKYCIFVVGINDPLINTKIRIIYYIERFITVLVSFYMSDNI